MTGFSMTQSFAVTGMTCDNCARHVKEALLGLPSVRSVEVNLDAGKATIEADHTISREHIAAALDEAGYGIA